MILGSTLTDLCCGVWLHRRVSRPAGPGVRGCCSFRRSCAGGRDQFGCGVAAVNSRCQAVAHGQRVGGVAGRWASGAGDGDRLRAPSPWTAWLWRAARRPSANGAGRLNAIAASTSHPELAMRRQRQVGSGGPCNKRRKSLGFRGRRVGDATHNVQVLLAGQPPLMQTEILWFPHVRPRPAGGARPVRFSPRCRAHCATRSYRWPLGGWAEAKQTPGAPPASWELLGQLFALFT